MKRIVRTFIRYDREDEFADEQLTDFLGSAEGQGLAVEAMTGDRGCLIVVLRSDGSTPIQGGGGEDA